MFFPEVDFPMTQDSRDPAAIHQPVLLEDCVRLVTSSLGRVESPVIVDCTLGLAGHATAFLKAASNARLVGIDRDAEALALATRRMEREGLSRSLVNLIIFLHKRYARK